MGELEKRTFPRIEKRLKTCGYEPFLLKEIDKNVLTAIRLAVEETIEEAKKEIPSCQNCTWCLYDDENKRWVCMYPFDDFGFEDSRCPKHKWFEKWFE